MLRDQMKVGFQSCEFFGLKMLLFAEITDSR